MRTIINTVGTSLLTNAARELGRSERDTTKLIHYLKQQDPEKASAETNSISKLAEEGDSLVFLHSQTEEGQLCAHLLSKYFDAQGFSCVIEGVPDLSYQESRFKMRGLRSLVSTIIRLIREERKKGAKVLLNATGGFKAEIAYATLIGLLFDVPVFYIHEAFREIIEMPPTPVAWDFTLMAEGEDFFLWLDDEPRTTAEADSALRRYSEDVQKDVRFLLTEEGGHTYLSPAGEVFFNAYREKVDVASGFPVYLSSAARRAYQKMAPSLQARFNREMRKLSFPDLRRAGSDQVQNCDCFVYPKGHVDERIFYYGDDENVYICELARHSDETYERLIAKGVWRNDYTDFKCADLNG